MPAGPGGRAAGAFRALLCLLLLGLGVGPAAGADQPDTLTFNSLPQALAPGPLPGFWSRHRTPLLLTGLALTAGSLLASEVLLRSADSRYDLYGAAVDPGLIETYYQQARTRDRWSNALLVAGELSAAATLVVAWHDSENSGGLRLGLTPLPSGAAVLFSWGRP
jgi:hypothetical protein